MKRIIFVFLFAVLTAIVSFAQDYTVQEVSGRVEKDLGNGNWAVVKPGEILRRETIIRTGIDAFVTVKAGEQSLRVDSSKTGKITEIAGNRGAIQIQGKVAEADTSAVRRKTIRIYSSAARANTAEEDEEVDED